MPNKKAPVPNEGVVGGPEHYDDDEKNIWLVVIKYAITYIVALGLFFLTLYLRNFFTSHLGKADYYRVLADAFTIPGMVFVALALLVFVSKKGAFTGLAYALRHVGRMLLPFIIRTDISYEEYLEARERRRGLSIILCFFIVGITFLIGAAVCIILFYQYFGN